MTYINLQSVIERAMNEHIVTRDNEEPIRSEIGNVIKEVLSTEGMFKHLVYEYDLLDDCEVYDYGLGSAAYWVHANKTLGAGPLQSEVVQAHKFVEPIVQAAHDMIEALVIETLGHGGWRRVA